MTDPVQPGGQIMPNTLLLANPDLKTQRHLCTMDIKCIRNIKAFFSVDWQEGNTSSLRLKHPLKNLLSINEVRKVFGLINFQKLNFPNFPFQKKVERLINVNVIAEFSFLSFPVKT